MLKITAQDIQCRFAPPACKLRVLLREKGVAESEPSEFEQVLMRLGQRHEAAHLATFPQVADLRSMSIEERAQETLILVESGAAVLYQPVLKCESQVDGIACVFVGAPDFLIRKDNGYVIRDVKMVRRVDEDNHPEVILQLQFYGWLYEQVFNKPPVRLEVFSGQSQVVPIPSDGDRVHSHLRDILRLKRLKTAPYEPVGWSKCSGCGFHNHCWAKAKKANDVALVFGVDQNLAVELHKQGTRTIKQLLGQFDGSTLAEFERPWGTRIQRVGKSAGAILRAARALLTSRETVFRRPAIPEHANYVMFDLEGIPSQFDELGKIYLWGMQMFGETPSDFMPAVAGFGKKGDSDGWSEFLEKAAAIFRQHGDIPFVHWSSYERTQIGEYVKRFGDVNSVAARVLRNLLDLLPITRDSVVLPLYSYSLKEVEKHVGFKRTQEEYGGSWSMAKYIEATEMQDETERANLMDQILLYNKEDLAATWAVLEWLKRKAAEISSG